VFGDFGIASLW